MMRSNVSTRLTMSALVVAAIAVLPACGPEQSQQVPIPGQPGAMKTAATIRAQRRLFDGAPPVIPHQNFRINCTNCHNERGMDVLPYGFAPASPHELTQGMSEWSRCQQCHVFSHVTTLFAESTFDGLRQDLRKGERLNPYAPPVMPHPIQMRENCHACHTGPAARQEIICPHPERQRCVQCHVQQSNWSEFVRGRVGSAR